MRIRVLLFAGLREKTGTGEMILELPDGCRLSDLQGRLGLEKQTWSPLAFAVNQSYVPSDTPLKDGDEVALIPPVAGG